MRDMTEHNLAEKRRKLSEPNNPNEIISLERRILLFLKDHMGIEAVGIRLKEGEDFPYRETKGFPDHFTETEKYLCARDENGEIIRNKDGDPCLECICGNVLQGRTSPLYPFFTEGGSFWTNSMMKLLVSVSKEECWVHTRNHCNREGYESVALIPLKSEEQIIGLLQLHDKRPDCFTLDLIESLEGIATGIGIAILYRQAEEYTRNSERSLRHIIEHNADSMIVVDKDGIIRFVNPATVSFFARSEEELLGSCFGFPMTGGERTEIDVVRPTGYGTAVAEINVVEIEWQGKSSYLASLRDITERKQAEDKLKVTLEKLKKTLAGTIQAVSLTIEARDPYTAGHQKRVSNLAWAIAQEMGLPQDTVENIRIAGIVHDIGKISVPADILSRPKKLTNIEFGLIKAHPQSGYDILKEAELPCPIAQIVLQHHERMDGSGYLGGLAGEQILFEARILAVADVVEAMASHRPYRPALSIDTALEEIEKNRDILYDAQVVDACIKLFKEKEFKFQ